MLSTPEKSVVLEVSASIPPAIVVNRLVKTYGTKRVLDELGLQVAAGEIYALLGPNGAGKTTLFEVLTTLTASDSGEAWVAGFNLNSQADLVREQIGVTFQETISDKQLSGRKLLNLHARLYGLSKAEIQQQITELTAQLGLVEVLDRPVRTYSGGTKRRLELARSLLTRPSVLLMDEPTAGLDAQSRAHLWSYLQQLRQEQNLTIFFTTHYLEEAEKMADRVGILEGGRLLVEGRPAELVSALGQEVVTLTGSGNFEAFAEIVRTQPWQAFVTISQTEAASPPLPGQKRIHLDQQATTESRPVLVQIGLKQAAVPLLKPLIEIAAANDFGIGELTVSRPGLNELFLSLTGRRLAE